MKLFFSLRLLYFYSLVLTLLLPMGSYDPQAVLIRGYLLLPASCSWHLAPGTSIFWIIGFMCTEVLCLLPDSWLFEVGGLKGDFHEIIL